MRLRTWAFLPVLVCLAIPVYSQSLSGLACSAAALSTPSLNQEGVTELAGDLLVTCLGGSPTPAGADVPTINLTLAFNTQVTSRLLGGSNNLTEAVLLINDPGSQSSGLTQNFCPADPSVNFACRTSVSGTGYGGGTGISPLQYANANIYQGVLTAADQITFFNVPVDPPGSFFPPGSSQIVTPVLSLRFKNIRLNASAFRAQDFASVSISTSPGIPISYPLVTLGTVSQMSRNVLAEQIPQCSVSSTVEPAFTVSLVEGSANSFHPQFPSTIADASVPGNIGNSTSGFLISGLPRTVASPGLADFATRIKLTFSGTPQGVTLYVPVSINSGIFPPDSPSTPTLTAALTSTESGPFSLVPATNGEMAAVSNNVAVYEVVSVLPESLTTVETLNIPVSLSYAGSPGSSPNAGSASVQIDFAPSTSTVVASAGPVPSFVMTSPSFGSYSITSCAVTGLLAYSASQGTLVNTTFANPLQALVKGSGVNPVNDSAITFTLPTNGPGALFAGGGNVAVAYSNAQGIATSPQLIANANLGPFNATAASGAMTVNLPLINLPGASTPNFSPIPNHNLGDAPNALSATAAAAAPYLSSLTPIAGSGMSQVFSFVFSDAGGANLISNRTILFNSTLNGISACTIQVDGVGIRLYSDDASTVFGPLTPSGSFSNSQCALNGSGSSVVNSGTTSTVTLSITFTNTFGGTKYIYAWVNDIFGNSLGWQTETIFTVPEPTPSVVSVTPNAASGLSQVFSFVFSDAGGANLISNRTILFNSTFNGLSACMVQVDGFGIRLYNDGASAVVGPLTPSGTLSNSQCALNGSGSSVVNSGTTSTVTLSVTFTTAFGGAKRIYAYVNDIFGNSPGWQSEGSTTVPVPPPSVVSVTPNAGSGTGQLFSFVFSDAGGAGLISNRTILFNSTFNGLSACLIQVDGVGIRLYSDNASTVFGPLTLGIELFPDPSQTVSNSQCSLFGGGSSIVYSDTTLTVNLAIAFTSAFGGPKNIYAYVNDIFGNTPGWQTVGTFTVPAAAPAVVSVTPNAGSGTS